MEYDTTRTLSTCPEVFPQLVTDEGVGGCQERLLGVNGSVPRRGGVCGPWWEDGSGVWCGAECW